MNPIERRDFLKGTATGVFAFTVGGVEVLLSAREARAQGVPLRLLKADEAQTIEALGETLVPGARAAGVAHFVDQQLSVPPEEALLEARILNVRPPYANFYRAAVDAVDNASKALNGGRKFAQLSPSEQHDLVDAMRQNKIQGWQGPSGSFVYLVLRSDAVDNASRTLNGGRKFAQLSPSEQHDFVDAMRQNKIQGWQGPSGSFVYLVLRSDAVDVVYGTMEGYEALGIPYMPHIAPEKRW